jgi:hypothetical protein
MHPSLTELTGHQCVVLKRVEVLGELQMAMGTREGLIGFDAKRQDNSDEYPDSDDWNKNGGHTSLPSVFCIATYLENAEPQEGVLIVTFTPNVDISSSRTCSDIAARGGLNMVENGCRDNARAIASSNIS